MMEAHTLDAWTRPSDRASSVFRNAMLLAGFAAPLFLWLAGVALVLAAEAAVARGRSRREAAESVCRRGLEIFILAFLFRLQAFIVSPGAHPITLFRVDILNIMGPAIAAGGLIWLVSGSRAVMLGIYAAVATAFAMLTPLARAATPIGRLPIWVQWYIRPSGDNTTFTGFPWAGFVFAGAAAGVLIVAGRESRAGSRTHVQLAFAGVLTIVAGFSATWLPSIYAESSFWTTSPTYFAIRVGVMTTALALLYFVQPVLSHDGLLSSVVARLGRSSLFVYWIHVELVYGYASWAIHRRLPLWGTALGYFVFTVFIYAVVVLRDRAADAWRRRKEQIAFQYKV